MTGIADLAPGDQIIVISRIINAPRELVFKAFTDPEHLAQFWVRKDLHLRAARSICKSVANSASTCAVLTASAIRALGIYRDITRLNGSSTPARRVTTIRAAPDSSAFGRR
jgi:uncharacterized protein YndB with AHSA1/START domain